nr:collagen-binding domain-containing protein [Methylobacillus glycogenes]
MKLKFGLMAILAVLSAPAAAGTIDLGVASNYNAFIFNDFSTYGNSIGGALAVGNNAFLPSNSIANGSHNQYGLVVGGDLNVPWGGGSLNGNAGSVATTTPSRNTPSPAKSRQPAPQQPRLILLLPRPA